MVVGNDEQSSVPNADVARRVDALTARGLELYGQGELSAALKEWKQAVELQRDAPRAGEYIKYVSENFDVLAAQFSAADVAATPATQMGAMEHDVDAPAVNLDSFDDAELLTEVKDEADAEPDSDELADQSPGAPRLVDENDAPVIERVADTPDEEKVIELVADAPDESDAFLHEAPTRVRSAHDQVSDSAITGELPPLRLVSECEDDPDTTLRSSATAITSELPPVSTAAVIIDDGLLDEAADQPDEAFSVADNKLRQTIHDLLNDAREALERRDLLAAVDAADAAAMADPDGDIASMVLHRHRDFLVHVYESHIGEMTLAPVLCVSMAELTKSNLDANAGFLISRIDGLLTYEDILDVAGMPRVDACRILSALLRQGLIAVQDGSM